MVVMYIQFMISQVSDVCIHQTVNHTNLITLLLQIYAALIYDTM